jgi:hypothetical protein
LAAVFHFNLAGKIHRANTLRVTFRAIMALANTAKAMVSHRFTKIGIFS